MLFSNFVATIRADLDAIRDDLGEFVSTVKTDTTAMLGLADEQNDDPALAGMSAVTPKHLEWEEQLWENPELLCEDPTDAPDWEQFVQSSPVKDEEVEMLLSGGVSEIIPELYRELVPSRTIHADFFKRLIYHRNRMNQAVRARMQELVMDEEETRWEDDSIGEIETAPKKPEQVEEQEEEKVTPSKNEDLKSVLEAELAKYKNELEQYKLEMTKLQSRVVELERALIVSEAERAELQSRLAEKEELPHKKQAAPSFQKPTEVEPQSPTISASSVSPKPAPMPNVPSTSWEALPVSPGSSSNEEPVLLSKTGEEDEEDDWE